MPYPHGGLWYFKRLPLGGRLFCALFAVLQCGGGPPPLVPLLLRLIYQRIKYLQSRLSAGGPNTFATPPENFRDFDFSHNTKCYVTLLLLYLLYETHTINTGIFVVFNGFFLETSKCKQKSRTLWMAKTTDGCRVLS